MPTYHANKEIKQVRPTSGTACYRLISIMEIIFQVQKVVLIPGPGTHVLFCTKIIMVNIGYIARTKNK
jgi:hypothetical protein